VLGSTARRKTSASNGSSINRSGRVEAFIVLVEVEERSFRVEPVGNPHMSECSRRGDGFLRAEHSYLTAGGSAVEYPVISTPERERRTSAPSLESHPRCSFQCK
jgi:hypothetical protein